MTWRAPLREIGDVIAFDFLDGRHIQSSTDALHGKAITNWTDLFLTSLHDVYL